MSNNFAIDISVWTKKAKGKIDKVVREIVLDVANSLIELSPVGNPDLWESKAPKGYVGGRFAANWQYGNNVIGFPEGDLPDIDATGNASRERIEKALPKEAAGLVHLLVNNLPYALRLEDGWSSQAPRGMVQLTVIMYQDKARKIAERERGA